MPAWQTPGRGTCSAFLVVRDGDATLDFARDVLGAEPLRTPLRKADGTLWNAGLALGDSTLMVSQGGPDFEVPGFVHV